MRAGYRGAARTVGVVLVLALAVFVAEVGLSYAADHRYEGQMGDAFNSDDDDGPAVQLGLTIAAVGLVTAGVVGTFVRRTRSLFLWSLLALGLVAMPAAVWAADHGPGNRCSYDRYGNYERCVSAAGAAQRDFALILMPIGLVYLVFWAVPRTGGGAAKRVRATTASIP